MFQVGDAVRVKAGSPVAMTEYEGRVPKWLVGQKLTNKHLPQGKNCGVEMPGRDHTLVKIFYLEPWNDAEEWDGVKWVAKKTETPPKPAVVMSAGGIYISRHDSTNAAVKTAKERSEAFPGNEYVVYQEKASFKVELKYPSFVNGDVMQAVKDTRCIMNDGCLLRKGGIVVVDGSGGSEKDPAFNAVSGMRLAAFPKCDFVKIGHIDLP